MRSGLTCYRLLVQTALLLLDRWYSTYNHRETKSEGVNRMIKRNNLRKRSEQERVKNNVGSEAATARLFFNKASEDHKRTLST